MQGDLFGSAVELPEGLRYEEDFLTMREEASLLDAIRALPLHEAQYKAYTARRRVASFGGRYDFSKSASMGTGPRPQQRMGVRDPRADTGNFRCGLSGRPAGVGDVHRFSRAHKGGSEDPPYVL